MSAQGNVPGNALGQVTTTLYDALGNVTNVTGATYPVSYGYDDWNRMVWMKTYRDENGAGDLTQWQYDLATGLVTNKVYADGKGTAYAYTADGKLSRRTWARGIATDYGYTAAGELSSVDYSDTTPDVTYTHDRLGRVVEAMTAGVCTNTYSYDVATLARSGETRRSIFGPTETLVRQQDVLGRPAGLTLGNDYAVGYGYDAVGRFGTVASTNTANAVTGQWTYERVPGSDLVAGWTADAGNYWRRSYEAQRDLIAETHSGYGATVLDSYAYTNDALGRRTARVDASVTTNAFGYNLRSEVISAMMGSDQFGYGYDPIGNRLTATNNTAVTTYFANELNQYTNIVSGASVTPTYDDDGNMLAFGNGWTATWDGENRLVQLTKDGEQIGYAYDHQSRRIAKQTAAGTEVFSYDDWAMIRHTAPGGAKTDYIYGLDLSGTPQGAGTVGGLLGMVRAGDTAPISYGYDANGNVTLLADGAGAVAARYAYDPFGNTLSATGALASGNPFRFSTKYCEDEVGLYYYGYRFYHPELGKWLSRDPIEEEGGLLLYGAMLNDPVNRMDYQGLISWWECSGYCASYHLKQMMNAIAAIEALVVTAEGMMELPISEKVINSGTERLTSLGNKIFQRINSATGSSRMPSAVKSALQQVAQWAKTSGTMKNLPGLRSKVDAARRFAKGGRTVLRMARGGVVAGAAIAVGIESYCMTACCRQDVREDYENRMNTSPEDFLGGGSGDEGE